MSSGPVKAKHNNALTSIIFLIVVIVPTILAGIYYFFIAKDIYVSQAQVAVQVEQNAISNITGDLAQALSGKGNSGKDSYVVKTFIESPNLSSLLKEKYNIDAFYYDDKADGFAALDKNHTREQFHSYYKKKLDIKYNTTTNIIELKGRAFTAEEAKKLLDLVIVETENFVNNLSSRIQVDTINFAQEKLQESEAILLDITSQLNDFRNKTENFDPEKSAGGVMSIIQNIESEKAKAEAELSAQREFFRESSPKVKALRAKLRALNNQIDELNGQLVEEGGAPLTSLLDKFEELKVKRDFAVKRYEAALTALEAAQLDAQKKQKYLISIVKPTLPEEAAEPQRLYETLTILVISFLIFGLGRFVFEAIRDNLK